ncbi:MAG: phenylalanine--tRNA ligase subunit alpha [Holosporales bacterium]|jgi:phenylalanyl-tRNA synthetase alpha chain|nr:phenylalanine--tRNA ligase subunit alpha [Holosporales bacterium]
MSLTEIENNLEFWINLIADTKTLEELDKFKTSILGKNGTITSAFKLISTSFSIEQKKEYGEKINNTKTALEKAIMERKNFLERKFIEEKLINDKLDITLPVANSNIGGGHIISKTIRKIKKYYNSRGFNVCDGPEIDTEFYNFDALNIPKHHPSRQSHDTFYINGLENTLLRTQTSTSQIRAMQEKRIPIRMISIGKTYRSDSLDATHSPMFYQLECLVVDRSPITIGNLKSELQKFLAFIFDIKDMDNIAMRFRPSYFPFTEPGIEIDCRYSKKGGNIMLNKDGDKWLEIAGAGIVHPNVYRNSGLGGETLYGFAYSFGIERLVMLKHGIQDIRSLYDTDIRWLKHYGSGI